MTTPESVEQEAKDRAGEDEAPEQVTEQLQAEGDVGAKGLERRDGY